MLTLPTGFQTVLTAGSKLARTVYELTLTDSTVLRYSSSAITWGGNAYTAMAVSATPVFESIFATRIPEVSVTFSNVGDDFRAYLAPDDYVARGRLVVRLLLYDATPTLLVGSLILFDGIMEQPRELDERTIRINAVGLIDNHDTQVPMLRTAEFCQWEFKDLVNCNYAGGLTTCDREFESSDGCTGRSRTFEFGGFLGIDSVSAWRGLPLTAAQTRPGGTPGPGNTPDPYGVGQRWYEHMFGTQLPFFNQTTPREPHESLAVFENKVPLLYGRRLTTGVLVERNASGWVGGAPVDAQFYLLSHGGANGIEEVVNWYADGQPQTEVYWPDGYLKYGHYWRPGTIGLDDDETNAEYVADPTTKKRAQNRDLHTGGGSYTGSTYSRMAYATMLQVIDKDLEEVTGIAFDVKGRKVASYVSGVAQAAAWSRNPVWCLIDFLLDPDSGLGRYIVEADIDLTVAEATATACDAEIDQFATTVSEASGGASYTMKVVDTSGFYRGQKVLHDGATTAYVEEIEGPDTLVLDTQIDSLVAETLVGKGPRYACDIMLWNQSAPNAVQLFLTTFHGYITYADGKIQIRTEKAEAAPSVSFKDFAGAAGYKIQSFRWLLNDNDLDRSINRVIVRYVDQDGFDHETAAFDHDHRFLTGKVNEISLAGDGIITREHAYRVAKLELDKRRELGPAAELQVGPIGLQLQPGDLIKVTHHVPDWTEEVVRVKSVERIGLGSPDEFFVKLSVIGYDAAIYALPTIPDRPLGPGSTAPAIVLSVNMSDNGAIRLTWTVTGNNSFLRYFSVYKSATTWGAGLPTIAERIARLRRGKSSHTYQASAEEIGTTLYFRVSASTSLPSRSAWSNEVSTEAIADDPTASGDIGNNRVFDGEFDNADNWTLTPGTGVITLIEANASVGGGEWTDPDNAHDGSTTTYATATVPDSDTDGEFQEYSFAAGTKSGQALAIVESLDNQAACVVYYSLDNGATYTFFGSVRPDDGKTELRTTLLSSVDMSLFRIKVIGRRGRIIGPPPVWLTGEHRCYRVAFEDTSTVTPPVAVIGDSVLTLTSDGVDYAEAWRPFPLQDPESNRIVYADGAESTIGVNVRSAAADADVEVVLLDISTATEYALLTIPFASVSSSFQAFVGLFTAPNEIGGGPLEIGIRTLSTSPVEVDQLEERPGSGVPMQYQTTGVEASRSGKEDGAAGLRTGFTRGPWTAGLIRKSTITGSTK